MSNVITFNPTEKDLSKVEEWLIQEKNELNSGFITVGKRFNLHSQPTT